MLNLEDGYEVLAEFLTKEQLYCVNEELQSVNLPITTGGIRNAEKKLSSIGKLSKSKYLVETAEKYLPSTPSLVRAILFNKTTDYNWLVAWHQDRTVAVSKKFADPKWGPWSIKDETYHVQPPIEVLNEMVTLRIHLDSTNQENGCLRVLPKSHDLGLLDQAAIHNYVDTHSLVLCEAKAGSALVMRPHLLHASSKATQPSQRRVLHLEYSSYRLPSGVAWA